MNSVKNVSIAALILSAFLFVFVSSSVFGEDKEAYYQNGEGVTTITSQVYLTDPKSFGVEHSYDGLEAFFIKSGENYEGDLDFAREIVPNDNGYYMAGNSDKACVSHYSTETGELKRIKLPFTEEKPDITSRDLILRSSPSAGKLFVAIPKINRIEIFDLRDGAFVESKVVPFNFQSFAVSPNADTYIFYSPMNVHQGGKSILITDEAFNIDHDFFTPPSILRRANWLASNSFKVYNGKVYFNPPTSGDIYEVFFDGSNMEKVFSGPSVSGTLIKYVQSMGGEEQSDVNNTYEAKKHLPIYDFQVTENKIAFQYFKDGRYFFTTVVDRETGRAISHQNAVFLDNIGDHLQYVFLTPSATENGDFLSTMNSENISMIHDNVSASVDKASVDFDLALFKFSYNFDELYEQGARDTEFTYADDEEEEVQKSNLLSNVLAFPNPMNGGDDKLQVRITLSPEKRNSIKKEFVTVQIFSAVSSSVVYEQKYALNQVLSGTALSIDSRNVPAGFSQILVVEGKGEILGATSVIKVE